MNMTLSTGKIYALATMKNTGVQSKGLSDKIFTHKPEAVQSLDLIFFIFYFYFYFFSLEIFEKSLTNYTACRPHRQGRAWFTLIRNKRSVVCVETREGEVSGSAWSDNGGRQG